MIGRGWDKSPSLSIIFGLSSKTQWLSGLYYADFISFTALLNCAEVGRRNRILTNYRFLSHSHFLTAESFSIYLHSNRHLLVSVFTFSEGMKNGISLTKSSEFNKIKNRPIVCFLKEESYLKQEMKSKRSKDQIIQAALSLFSNKGYKETTMADLVTVTGLSKGLFTITSKVKKRFYNS